MIEEEENVELTDPQKEQIRRMAELILDRLELTRREVMVLCVKYSGKGWRGLPSNGHNR